MAYDSIWVRLNEAAKRVMDATECSEQEAQADICRAVYDRAIRFQARLKKHATRHITSTSVLEGGDFEFRKPIKPADLNWEESRPLKPWLVERDKYKPAGFWTLDSIELSADDITSVLCAGGQAKAAAALSTAKTNSRPKTQAARRAIQALYRGEVPDQAALPEQGIGLAGG